MNRLFHSIRFGLASALAVLSFAAHSAIPNVPLYIGTQINPNIIFTLDDSGSMSWGFMPDNIGLNGGLVSGMHTYWPNPGVGGASQRRFFSPEINTIYYHPNILYTPPPDSTGTPLTTSFTAAWINPFIQGQVSAPGLSQPTMNLATSYQATVEYRPAVQINGYAWTPGYYGAAAGVWQLGDIGLGVGHRVGQHPPIDYPVTNPQVGVPAYYYVFDTATSGCNGGGRNSEACYRRVVVSATSGTNSLIGADERQNFANWYSFYRTRNLATISSMLRAQTSIPGTARVAWQALNSCKDFNSSSNCQGWNGATFDQRIQKFANNRTTFHNYLTRLRADGGTPLRDAVIRAGEYFRSTGVNSPTAADPQVAEQPLAEAACRRNFHVVMTDGSWNTAISAAATAPVLNDSALVSPAMMPAPGDTTLLRPYLDAGSTNTIADLAWHYYMTDLHTSIPNKVDPYLAQKDPNRPTGQTVWTDAERWNPRNDPAAWQHVVHFTVGLGLGGTLNLPSPAPSWSGATHAGQGYADLLSGTATWPAAFDGGANNAYDLWHAAINSRGEFFSADTPDSLAIAFKTIIERINETTGAPAGSATSSFRTQSSSANFVGQFDSSDWSGSLIAEQAGTTSTKTRWNTSNWKDGNGTAIAGTMPVTATNTDGNARNVISHNGTNAVRLLGSGAVNFATAWSQLSAAQRDALDPTKSAVQTKLGLTVAAATSIGQRGVFEYLLGSRQHELLVPTTHVPAATPTYNSGTNILRSRKTLLGDILGSTPSFAWQDDAGYGGAWWGTGNGAGDAYSTFLDGKGNRTPLVAVGSNNGMLHGFNARTGQELFVYVPRGVYPEWARLAGKNYTHRYYVDGQITITDAFVGGSWKTVLIGSTGAGGKNLFALDITNPTNVTESSVLFDIDLSTDNDMGKFLGRPSVSRMKDGQFWALYGNGTESSSNRSALFAVRLSDGKVTKLVTSEGDATDRNGMSTVTLLRDGVGAYVGYAGDRLGNLWKFDFSGASDALWNIDFSNKALYSAVGPNGSTRQPISAAPLTMPHPLGGQMVMFGTGAFYDSVDHDYDNLGTAPVQSFYGVWDDLKGKIGSGRNKLVEQTLTTHSAANGDYRDQSSNNVNWANKRGWYMDFTNNGNKQGERVLARALRIEDRIVFSTFIPSSDVCSPGGTSWIMSMEALDGAGPANRVFLDGNNDGKVDAADKGRTGMHVAGGTGELLINLANATSSGSANGERVIHFTLKPSYEKGTGNSGVGGATSGTTGNTRGACMGNAGACDGVGVKPNEFGSWRQMK